ncbi:hypothetical protein RFI_03783, partial [Reticulomyxa filosa]
KSIEDELNKWKIQIRLEQDKYNPAVQCLNEEDVEFENILNVMAFGKELIVIDLFLLNEPMICLELFHFKILLVCFWNFIHRIKQIFIIIMIFVIFIFQDNDVYFLQLSIII